MLSAESIWVPHFSPLLREVGILLARNAAVQFNRAAPCPAQETFGKKKGPKSEAVSGASHPVKVTIIIAPDRVQSRNFWAFP